MKCYKCGLELGAFETDCPRCARQTTPGGTQVLPDMANSKTTALVQMEQCPNCRFIVFAADQFCSGCGTPIDRSGTPKRVPAPAARSSVVTPGERKLKLPAGSALLWLGYGAIGLFTIVALFYMVKLLR